MDLPYDLGASGLDDVELVMAFEQAFDVAIPDKDADKIRKFRIMQEVSDYIGKLRKGGN